MRLWLHRGGRDFDDLTLDEMQKGIGYYDYLSGSVGDIIEIWDEEGERVALPLLKAAYYEFHANMERLRVDIANRKESQGIAA